MLLAERLKDGLVSGEAFNFSTESPLSVLDLVKVIQRVMKCEHLEPDIRDCAEGEIRLQDPSATKAREILGWRPEYALENGLRETVDWYRGLLSN